VPIFRCQVTETVISQYCGYFSRAGVTWFSKFFGPKIVDPQSCCRAFKNKGQIEIGRKIYFAAIGTSTSQSDFLVGVLDDENNCETGIFHDGKTGKSFGGQTETSVLEISLSEENGFVSELSGEIRLSEGLVAKTSDLGAMNSTRGTYIWEKVDSECPETLVQLYRGDLRFFVNSMEAGSLVGGLAVLDKDDQVAGLELISPLLLCYHAAWKTHLTGFFVVIHGDIFTSKDWRGGDSLYRGPCRAF